MRLTAIIIMMLGLTTALVFGQSAADQVMSLSNEKNYEEAAGYIPDAVKEKYKDLNFILLCGDVYFELERYEDALKMYEKADDIDGGEPPVLRKIGRVYSVMGKHKQALEILKDAVDEDKKDAASRLELAQAYLRCDSIPQAEINITRARELDSENPDAFVALGDLYFAQRVYELAKDNYEEALSLDETLIEARIKLAISYYWLANREIDQDLSNEYFARSLKEWNTVSQMDPKNAKAWFQQGKILFFSQKFVQAAQSFYKYVQLRPTGYLGMWYLGQALYEVGKCDSAAPHLEVVAENIDSVRTKSRLLLARCYFDNKDYEKAVGAFENLKTMQRLEELDYKRFAASAFNMGDTSKAIELYLETIEEYPDGSCKLMYSMGKTMIRDKMYDKAIYLFNKRLTTQACDDEGKADIYYWMGVSHFLAERPDSLKPATLDSAKNFLFKSLELDSLNFKSRLYLGDVYAAMDDMKSAISEFEFVIERLDTATDSATLNKAYSKLTGIRYENKDKGIQPLINIASKWAKSFPNSLAANLYLAIAYQIDQKMDQACKYYRKVVKIDPKNKTARKYLSELGCNG